MNGLRTYHRDRQHWPNGSLGDPYASGLAGSFRRWVPFVANKPISPNAVNARSPCCQRGLGRDLGAGKADYGANYWPVGGFGAAYGPEDGVLDRLPLQVLEDWL